MNKAAADCNAFAVDLYGQLARCGGNLVFSPYSIMSALAMVYGGARGETAAEMERVLHLSLGGNFIHQAWRTLTRDLNRQTEGRYELAVANCLWGQRDYEFLASYLVLVHDHYGAGLEPLDFQDPEGSRKKINDWVERETRGRIKAIAPEGAFNALTRLVLTNAAYFKGPWERVFKKKDTEELPFSLSPRERAPVTTMYQMDTFGLGSGPDCRILEMDYEGGNLSMVILLPRKTDGLSALERKLDGAELSKWLCTLVRQEVMVYLPRFRFEDKINLKEQLWGMGMESAFELGRADFSGMAAGAKAQGLCIDQALHRACLEVNEEGSEAAGATVVEMEMLGFPSEEEPEFRADHPFIFLIRDKRSGVILFLGRVMDPRGLTPA